MVASNCFAMTFSQPVRIGYVGYTPQPTYKGLPIANATYNDGILQNEKISKWYFRDQNIDPNSINVKTYVKGVAGWDELYCEYDVSTGEGDLKFGGKQNYFLITDTSNKKISKIDTDKGLKIYVLYHNYCYSRLHILGKQENGKWFLYVDSKKISDTYFGGNDGYKKDGGVFYDEPTCNGDTIIVVYRRWHWKGPSEPEGEFRFKWDDAAQWFGIEKIVY